MMLKVDLKMPATVVITPPEPRIGHAATAKRDISLASAIRYVVEQLPAADRPRAVIRTSTKSLLIEDIEALYGDPAFPKPLASDGRNL